MTKKTELADYQAVKAALLEAAGDDLKIVNDSDGNTKRVELPRSAYLKLMEQHGLTKALLDQTHDATAKITGAMMLLAADHAELAVAAATAKGLDPKDVDTPKIVLKTVDGQLESRTKVYDTGRNPRTGEPTESFGRTSVKLNLSTTMSGGAVLDTHIRDTFTRLLGAAG